MKDYPTLQLFITFQFYHLLVYFLCQKIGVSVMVFNATFNNILVISWQSVLMVEETGISGDRH
jgi:hypothetical protein